MGKIMSEDIFKKDLQLLHQDDTGASVLLVVQNGDLQICEGRDNLAQAIWLRLATSKGELANLGHKDYGSRLNKLIGRRINTQTIELAKAYIREALRQVPRIRETVNLDVMADPQQPNTLRATFSVVPEHGPEIHLQLHQRIS